METRTAVCSHPLRLSRNSLEEVDLLKTKILSKYVKMYTNEMKRLVSSVPEQKRSLLPDHVISNQEIEIYVTKETGIVIDYVGLSKNQRISVKYSDRCYDDIIFPPTENHIPCNVGGLLKLKSLAESNKNEPITTVTLQGDFNGIALFRVKGAGHFFTYDKKIMADHSGRHVFFNLYVQREYSDGNVVSRFVRYAELYPKKSELFTSQKAILNARKDLSDYLSIVANPEFAPRTQKYVKMGEAVAQLKKNSVIVLGKDSPLLRRIRDELRTLNYASFLVKEQPDLPDQSPEEKVKLYSLISKFAVMEDSFASGHIVEFEYCKTNRVVLALLRQKGKGSTWMIGDAPIVDVNYIKNFEYTEKNLHSVLSEACQWAESFSMRRADAYKDYFP